MPMHPEMNNNPDFVPTRRSVLGGMAGLGAGLGFMTTVPVQAQEQTLFQQSFGVLLGDGRKFSAANVLELARVLSKRPYQGPVSQLSDVFTNLDADGYAQIKAQQSTFLWEKEGRGFTIEPLQRPCM